MAMSFERLRNLGRASLIMIGAVAAVAGTFLFIVLTHHGPAVCTNASFCGQTKCLSLKRHYLQFVSKIMLLSRKKGFSFLTPQNLLQDYKLKKATLLPIINQFARIGSLDDSILT